MDTTVYLGAKGQERKISVDYEYYGGFKGSRFEPPEPPSATPVDFSVYHPILKKYMPGKRYYHLIDDLEDFLESFAGDCYQDHVDYMEHLRDMRDEARMDR